MEFYVKRFFMWLFENIFVLLLVTNIADENDKSHFHYIVDNLSLTLVAIRMLLLVSMFSRYSRVYQ